MEGRQGPMGKIRSEGEVEIKAFCVMSRLSFLGYHVIVSRFLSAHIPLCRVLDNLIVTTLNLNNRLWIAKTLMAYVRIH